MSKIIKTIFLLLLVANLGACSSYQVTKNVWKGTRSLWYTYVSPPAYVDFDEKGDLSKEGKALSSCMIGIDVELAKVERVMQNADKPPMKEWVSNFLSSYPWLSGFAGIKYDGTILGHEPAGQLKQLDFNPLLYEDKKQNSRALRADAQNTPLGPEVLLATPLYDGIDFLGVVVAHFEMKSLMRHSNAPENMVVLTPNVLLWPGKYDFASTPLAGVKWEEVVRQSSQGTCSNTNGKFIYTVRWLANLPIVFAVPESGTFPEGNGSTEQGLAYFPAEREKMPPPPLPERKPGSDRAEGFVSVGKGPNSEIAVIPSGQRAAGPSDANVIPAGSSESVLLKGGAGSGSKVGERQLEGENVSPERVRQLARERARQKERQARQQQQRRTVVREVVLPDPEPAPVQQVRRPSPFGSDSGSTSSGNAPSGDKQQGSTPAAPQNRRPSPFGD